jgi:hypothetical protein
MFGMLNCEEGISVISTDQLHLSDLTEMFKILTEVLLGDPCCGKKETKTGTRKL